MLSGFSSLISSKAADIWMAESLIIGSSFDMSYRS